MKELSIYKGGMHLLEVGCHDRREMRREDLLSPWNFRHDLWEFLRIPPNLSLSLFKHTKARKKYIKKNIYKGYHGTSSQVSLF